MLAYHFVVFPIVEEDVVVEGGGDRGVCMGVRHRNPEDIGDFNPSWWPIAVPPVPTEEIVVPLLRGTATRRVGGGGDERREGGGGDVAGFR